MKKAIRSGLLSNLVITKTDNNILKSFGDGDKSGLIKKEITNKAGHKQTVYVRNHELTHNVKHFGDKYSEGEHHLDEGDYTKENSRQGKLASIAYNAINYGEHDKQPKIVHDAYEELAKHHGEHGARKAIHRYLAEEYEGQNMKDKDGKMSNVYNDGLDDNEKYKNEEHFADEHMKNMDSQIKKHLPKAKEDAENEKGNKMVDDSEKKIKQHIANNNHGDALEHLATNYVGGDLAKNLQAINKEHERKGYLTPDMSKKRTKIANQVFQQLRDHPKLSEEHKEKLFNAFNLEYKKKSGMQTDDKNEKSDKKDKTKTIDNKKQNKKTEEK